MYLFYLINRLVDYEEGLAGLPEIHRRVGVGALPPHAAQPSPPANIRID